MSENQVLPAAPDPSDRDSGRDTDPAAATPSGGETRDPDLVAASTALKPDPPSDTALATEDLDSPAQQG